MQSYSFSRPIHDTLSTSALVCSLYILCYDASPFQETLSIQSKQATMLELYSETTLGPKAALNRKILRQISYKILQPLLNTDRLQFKENFVENHFLLRNYLKKFHFFYRYFFGLELLAEPKLLGRIMNCLECRRPNYAGD